MSMITVVTRISPITSGSEDFANLVKPSELGKPIEVRKCSLTDPRTGQKYNVETTFCISKANTLENQKKRGLTPLTDPKCALNNASEKNTDKELGISVPKNISKDKISRIFTTSKLKELERDSPSQPSIKLHLNLKKIREATRQRSLTKKREKLVQPLLKYFINKECLICGTTLNESTKNKILIHMQLHIKLGTYACHICENKCFSTADALFNHSVKHIEKRSHKCDQCKKTFSRKHFLSIHYEKEHPQLIPKLHDAHNANLIKKKVPTCFVCTICKVQLTSWKLLLIHKSTHSGKESYLCLFCNKSFTTSCLLRYHSHIRIISKRHHCKFCRKAFSSLHRLHGHERIHSKKVHYKCKECGKKFNFRNSLVEHMQLHHS